MKLALIGLGAMGRMVEARSQHAAGGGHVVVLRLGRSDARDARARAARIRESAVDAVIDFSSADAVLDNIAAAMEAGTPIVVGTTGWGDRLAQAHRAVRAAGGVMVHGANFSIGVNVYYRLVRFAAEMLSRAGGYDPFIEEQHHARKKDAPSGTALQLRTIVSEALSIAPDRVGVAATRAGFITGTHRVGFDGAVDQIVLTHAAKSREGFADGAILAARWAIGRAPGVYAFDRVMDEVLAPGDATGNGRAL